MLFYDWRQRCYIKKTFKIYKSLILTLYPKPDTSKTFVFNRNAGEWLSREEAGPAQELPKLDKHRKSRDRKLWLSTSITCRA